jgi:ribonuclease E
VPNGNAASKPVEADDHPSPVPQTNQGPQTEQQGQFGEGHRRKRRRRRGRRGGRDRENSGSEQRANNGASGVGEAAIENRFGQRDEVDTTPREKPGKLAEIQPAQITRPEAIPNAASTPVWSLKAERAETPPKPPERKAPVPAAAAPNVPAAPQPAKKGWWQRAFRKD